MSRVTAPLPSSAALRKAVPALVAWYTVDHRDLPWRRTSDPYAIWVSEIMLQQTQVQTVLAYYEAFLRRFPTVECLAAADESEVLKLWEGLGYYRRARHLQAAAKAVAARGGWPEEVSELEELPGAGRSTAGAVASLAFHKPAPILDGNVKRVWSRLFALGSVDSAASLQALWRLSEEAVRLGPPATVNQALMELGATICTPKHPLCGQCPVRTSCRAFREGTPENYPASRPRKSRPLLDVSVAFLWKEDRFLVTRRPDGGFLGGLWELPGGKWEPGEDGPAALRRELEEELRLAVTIDEAFPPIRHGYSHFEVRLHAFSCRPSGSGKIATQIPHRWIRASERHALAFPSGTLKIFEKVLAPDVKAAESGGEWDA